MTGLIPIIVVCAYTGMTRAKWRQFEGLPALSGGRRHRRHHWLAACLLVAVIIPALLVVLGSLYLVWKLARHGRV